MRAYHTTYVGSQPPTWISYFKVRCAFPWRGAAGRPLAGGWEGDGRWQGIQMLIFTAIPHSSFLHFEFEFQVVVKEGVQFQNPPGQLENGLSTSKSTPRNPNVEFDCNPTFRIQL